MAKKAKKKPAAKKKQTKQIAIKDANKKPKKQVKGKEKKVEKKVEEEKIKEPPPTLHAHMKSYIASYKEGIDPKKAEKLKKSLHVLLTKGGPSLLAIIALSATLLLIDLFTDNRVLANTKVGGIELGYMKIKDAQNKILVEMDQYTKAPIEFSYQDQKLSFTPEELGLQFSPAQTFLSIPTASFQRNTPFVHVLSHLTSRNIPIKYTIDEDKALSLLENKFDLKKERAKNARFILVEDEYQVLPEEEGIAINSSGLLADLKNDFNSLSSDSITVSTEREYPRIDKEMLAKEKDKLLALLQKPILLYSGDKSTTLNLAHNLSAVKFAEKTKFILPEEQIEIPIILKDQGSSAEEEPTISSNIEVELDEENIMYLLNEAILKDIEVPTSGVSIYRADDGSIKIEGQGRDGKSVPKTKLLKSITLAVNNSVGEVEIPVHTEIAPLTISKDLQELGIKELIATGHSAYYGSPPNRMYNIDLGTSRYDGLLIKPGEEFSFNKHLGNVDASSGYLPEKVIKKNKVEVEYGGGICQVSTTMYRAALLAGLPITERNPHSWKVSYYGQSMGHGLDATIYPGSSDVKFINDTPGHIIVHSYTIGSEAYFSFYGTKDSRQIEMVGPIGGGLHYKWYRYITKDGEKIEETIISDYKPVPAPEPPPQVIAQNPEDGF